MIRAGKSYMHTMSSPKEGRTKASGSLRLKIEPMLSHLLDPLRQRHKKGVKRGRFGFAP
jgi:hypothetical protein